MMSSPLASPAGEVPASGQPAPWDRISFAPPDAWVAADSYGTAVRGREGDPVTRLLWSRQVNAGAGLVFHNSAARLETAVAVRQESQWSVELDSRNQRLTVHWLRIVRDGVRIDHLHRDRLRLVPRETEQERLAIDGVWRLVTVLHDVRPGDVLEAAFTLETVNPLRPGSCEVFFAVPPRLAVGCYRLRVLSDPARRELVWKASADAPALRQETLADGRRRWTWEGAQLAPREPEPNQPGTFLDHVWVQVSDLADWRDLATRAAAAWAQVNDDAGLGALPGFAKPNVVNEDAVVGLVQHIQDHFRYLSIDLGAGGWIPAAPAVVARRRQGDCKDLVWLCATVLRQWGVSARPVLVGADLREQVAALLPMTLLFNHAVIEVEVAGKRRWFDLTERFQGGDYAGRSVTWFDRGLPLDAASSGLSAQPGERPRGVYDWRETLLADTRRGQYSLVEHRIRAEGWQADRLRETWLAGGADAFAKDRDRQAQQRYGKAHRVGALEWRDDRANNVCEFIEAFEVRGFIHSDETRTRMVVEVPPNVIVGTFVLPEDKPRRAPWALPFPLDMRHEITIRSTGVSSGTRRRRQWAETGFTASLDEPKTAGSMSKISQITVTAPEIAAEHLPAFRKQLERFLIETTWRVPLPKRTARSRRTPDFGVFAPEPVPDAPAPENPPADGPPRPPVVVDQDLKLARGGGSRRRRRATTLTIPIWTWPVAAVILVAFVVILARKILR